MTITFTEHLTEVTFTDQTEAGFTFVTQIGGTGGGGDVPPARLLPATIGDDGQVATVVSGAPAWADPADSGAPLSDAAPEPLAETAAAGTAEEAARADHQHELPTPSQIGVWDSETLLIGESHLPASIARDTEVTAAVSEHAAATDPHGDRAYAASLGSGYQPIDSDLTAIAALTTTSYGRALLTLANQAALLATLGTGTPSASTVLYGNGAWGAPQGIAWSASGWAAGDAIDLTQQVGTGSTTANAHGSTAASDGTAVFVAFALGQPLTLDALGVEITTAAGAGTVRLGIYNDSGGRPGTVAIDAGTASVTSAGLKTLTFSAVTLPVGHYYAVCVFQGITGTNPAYRSTAAGSQAGARAYPPATGSASVIPYWRSTDNSVTGAFGTNPALSAMAVANLTLPRIYARTA